MTTNPRIHELERAVGAATLAMWRDVASDGADFATLPKDSAISMIFSAAGFNPLTDSIVDFRNAYMARFAPGEES